MKKIILILATTLLAFGMNAQLNHNATVFKSLCETDAECSYKKVRTYAVNEWGNDHSMVVYCINKQCDALADVVYIMNLKNYDNEILLNAMAEWESVINGITCWDWQMVLYTYNKQIRNKDY